MALFSLSSEFRVQLPHLKYKVQFLTNRLTENETCLSKAYRNSGIGSHFRDNRLFPWHIEAEPLEGLGAVKLCGYRERDSVRYRDIDSNGRTNFFRRWWNRPELQLDHPPRIVSTRIQFLTHNGKEITKEVRLLEVPVGNIGNDDAFAPEMRAVPISDTTTDKDTTAMFALRKEAAMLGYRVLRTRSNEPTEQELAVTFLKEGLKSAPLIAGNTWLYIVFGFMFKDGQSFHLASEDVLTFLSIPLKNNEMKFRLTAKARNSGQGLLCKRAVLSLGEFDKVKLSCS
jgi:hypothetical protein